MPRQVPICSGRMGIWRHFLTNMDTGNEQSVIHKSTNNLDLGEARSRKSEHHGGGTKFAIVRDKVRLV